MQRRWTPAVWTLGVDTKQCRGQAWVRRKLDTPAYRAVVGRYRMRLDFLGRVPQGKRRGAICWRPICFARKEALSLREGRLIGLRFYRWNR